MPTLDSHSLDLVFRQARTHTKWLDKSVSDDTLREIYDLMKFGPTSMNVTPARILFLRTREAKERLRPALAAGNVEKTMAAPATAIIAYDEKFYDNLGRLFPQSKGAREIFANKPELAENHGLPKRHAAGRLFHPGRTRSRSRLRADVRIR